MFELDHALVWCAPGAPEAEELERAGLRVGRRRAHPGQGTANACFFFDDAMLELIWIADEREALSPPASDLRLSERARWRETGACPIGIALRGVGPPPFPTWSYTAPFLPAGVALAMAASSGDPGEPLLFAVPENSAPGAAEHPFSRRRVTRATVTVAALRPDSLLRDLPLRNVRFAAGGEHSLELELDGGAAGQVRDFGTELPLVLRW